MDNFVSFKDILDLSQVEAVANKLGPTEEGIWRFYCRKYSKLFHTPLHLVHEMDATMVLREVIEDRLDGEDEMENIDKYLDTIYMVEDPDYETQRDQAEDDFLQLAQEEEAERVRLGKPIHPALKGESTLIPDPAPKTTLPKSGGINLQWLEKEEQ